MKTFNVVALLIIFASLVLVPSCTRVARPAAELMQSWLGSYHVEVDASAPGSALVSIRGVVLTGSAAARFKVTAPGADGVRKTIIERGIGKGEFGAWKIHLFDAGHDHWIRIERVGCDAARELFSELPPCGSPLAVVKAAMMPEVKVVEDIVVERVRP